MQERVPHAGSRAVGKHKQRLRILRPQQQRGDLTGILDCYAKLFGRLRHPATLPRGPALNQFNLCGRRRLKPPEPWPIWILKQRSELKSS